MPMPERFAIYFAPERGSLLDERAEAWLGQAELKERTISARRYGFHATLKAPMRLSRSRGELAAAMAQFSAAHRPVEIGGVAPRLIDGFLALTAVPQPRSLTDFAARVVTAFEPFRASLEPEDRTRRLQAPLSVRQVELVGQYGYPYVLEQFQFHMTLTDRLPVPMQDDLRAQAVDWFAAALALPLKLDRLVLFCEPEPGANFVRLDDYRLGSAA